MVNFRLIFFSVSATFLLGACGARHEMGMESQSSFANRQQMASLFEQTLYPVLSNNCRQCHGINQTPMFAQYDVLMSYEALNSRSLVSLTDPQGSYMVAKIRGGHQNFPNAVADEIVVKIQEWAALVEQLGVVPPNPGTGTNPLQPALTGVLSVDEFGKTLYPVIQVNCSGCHGVDQQPMFAMQDVTDSHDYLVNTQLVRLDEPAASRIVTQVKSGHQNFSNQLGQDLENQIRNWANNVVMSGGNLPQPPPLEPTFKSIHNLILIPKCLSCHSPGGERPRQDYSDYTTTMRTGKVKAGDANDSDMYKECVSGEMPEDAPNLSSAELTAIRDWINSGAPNN